MNMIKLKKVRPLFTGLVTTMDVYEDYAKTSSGIIDGSKKQGSLKEYQKVVAVGTTVRDIQVGDIVWVNPKRFAVMKHKPGSLQDGVIKDNQVLEYNFDVLEIDGKKHLLLQDRDIEFIVDEYEEIEESKESPIINLSPPSIILS